MNPNNQQLNLLQHVCHTTNPSIHWCLETLKIIPKESNSANRWTILLIIVDSPMLTLYPNPLELGVYK